MRGTRSLVALAIVAVISTGCTDDGTTPRTPTTSTPRTSAPPTVDQGPVSFIPGAYRYEFGGVSADLRFDEQHATLEVSNASGDELGAPGVYVISPDDARHDAEVTPADGIADGDEATFELAFDDPLDVRRLGLVILTFGDSNYGAFAPVASTGDAGSA
jgi:hypothetical protein